jgi:hypothetical protein
MVIERLSIEEQIDLINARMDALESRSSIQRFFDQGNRITTAERLALSGLVGNTLFGSQLSITLSSDSFELPDGINFVELNSEGGSGTLDTLDTITVPRGNLVDHEGRVLLIKPNTTDTIKIRDGNLVSGTPDGEIFLRANNDTCVLGNEDDVIMLIVDVSASDVGLWREILRSPNLSELWSRETQVISSGSLVYRRYFVHADGEGGAADTLTTMTGGIRGNKVLLHRADDDITINDGGAGDEFQLNGGGTYVLDDAEKYIEFIHDGSNWIELFRSR